MGQILTIVKLTKIEKSSLIKSIDSLTSEFANNSTAPIINDKRLLEILQGDSSKVVDENGEPLVVWHGTNEKFNEFDRTKSRNNMDIQGNFFSPWEDDAKGYGRNVRKFYIKLNNPATFGQGLKALKLFQGLNKAGEKAANYLIKKGYDGVNNDDEEYIVFDSENIKSADPVTYDDEGNVIPLSQRFDQSKKDIRYSLVNPEAVIPYAQSNIDKLNEEIGLLIAQNEEYFNGNKKMNVLTVRSRLKKIKKLLQKRLEWDRELRHANETLERQKKDIRYSLGSTDSDNNKYDYHNTSFRQQLDDFFDVKNASELAFKNLYLGESSDVIKELGLELPMVINYRHAAAVIKGLNPRTGNFFSKASEAEDHRFSYYDKENKDEFAKLPDKLKKPVIVTASMEWDEDNKKYNIAKDSFEVYVDMTSSSGKQVIVPFMVVSTQMNNKDVIALMAKTVHGNSYSRKKILAALKQNSSRNKTLFYVDKGKTTRILTGNVSTLRGNNITIPDGLINKLTDEGSPVKEYIENTLKRKRKDNSNFSLKTNGKSYQQMWHEQQANFAKKIEEKRAADQAEDAKGMLARAADYLDKAEYNFADRGFYLKQWQAEIENTLSDDPNLADIFDNGKLKEEYDAKMLLDTMHGRIQTKRDEFQEKYWNPIQELAKKNKVTYNDLNRYLFARHAEERDKYIASINPEFANGGHGSGWQDSWGTPAEVIAQLEKKYGSKVMQKLGNDFDAMNNALIDQLVEYHLMSKNTAQMIRTRYKHYTPLKRFDDAERAGKDSNPAELNVGQNLNARAYGRTSEPEHMLTFAKANIDTVFRKGEKNLCKMAMLNLALRLADNNIQVSLTMGQILTIVKQKARS